MQRRFAAVALAHRRADAVGPVRFTFEPTTLRIDLLRVGRFAAGFTFVAAADTVTQRVPYRAIRALLRDGAVLHLVLDERVATPFSRFALSEFRRGPEVDLQAIFRRRSRLRLGLRCVPLPLAVALTLLLPTAWVGGPVGMLAVCFALVTALSFAAQKALESFLSGGAAARRLSEQFEAQIAERLGLEPEGAVKEVLQKESPVELSSALSTVARPARLLVFSMAAVAAAVVSLWLVQKYGVVDRVEMPTGQLSLGIRQRFRPLVKAAVRAGTPKGRPCVCGRVDAAMWRQGMREVAVLITPHDAQLSNLWIEPGRSYAIERSPPASAPGREGVDLEVAVINNTRHRFDTLDLVVTFARRDEKKQRRVTVERGLHWPGVLGPGKAVKWSVRGFGSELKVETRFSKARAEDKDLVDAEVFWSLGKARLASVRLHGAMMLAYLGDPRAPAALAELKGLSPAERRAKERVAATFEALAFCDLKQSPQGLSGCVFNGSDALLRQVKLIEWGSSRHSWTIRDLFRPKHGLMVTLKRRTSANPGHIQVKSEAPKDAP